MSEAEVIEIVKSSLNELLRWVGFGTLTGLAAKAIMPGRDPGGAVGTMLMGIGGSVIGCGTVLFFWRDAQIDPISGKGFVAATLGAFSLLFFYRLLAGSFFAEGSVHDDRVAHETRRKSRRRRILEDLV
ncbi:MAG: GlsB/YeaQ/YmgE family stress response membrane protein [Planctomycetaceae bacterium]|nr:GlsB/YeaQ/YmgE family stress response membrane protein [Planctomycetaceae bacterium]